MTVYAGKVASAPLLRTAADAREVWLRRTLSAAPDSPPRCTHSAAPPPAAMAPLQIAPHPTRTRAALCRAAPHSPPPHLGQSAPLCIQRAGRSAAAQPTPASDRKRTRLN